MALVLCMPVVGLGWSLGHSAASQRRPKYESSPHLRAAELECGQVLCPLSMADV